MVKLWGAEGALLAQIETRSQVTALTMRGRLMLVGTSRGEVEPIVMCVPARPRSSPLQPSGGTKWGHVHVQLVRPTWVTSEVLASTC